MQKNDPPPPFASVGPASDGARAQLALALLTLALLPVALISQPRPTHELSFYWGMIPEELTPEMTAEHSGWIRPFIRSTARWRRDVVSDYIVPGPEPSAPRHRLELLPAGELLLDSRPIGLEELRARLDFLMTTTGWVDFSPDPEARFEDVVETLAPVAYSDFDRLRLDNSRFAAALDAAPRYEETP